jgi:glycosyltransferase involved in cell wall biosynthesis
MSHMGIQACVLTSAHPPFDIRIFHKECKSLARAGYDVTLIASCPEDCEVDGVRLRAIPKAKGRVERVTRTLRHVYRKAMETSADIYHFHDPELIPVGLLLRARGKKVVYDIHEDLPRCMPYKPYLPRWVGKSFARIIEILEDSASRFFSGLVTATPGIASRFCALNDRTVIVHNYPLARELTMLPSVPWESRDMAIAYVGSSVTIGRGGKEMVEAMGLLPADLKVTLEMVGPFLPAELKEQLSTDPGWSRVKPYGFVDRKGVANVLGRVRAGLVVEHPEPNYVAGKPIKMFEYMAAGIPVVSSDFPLWRQIVDGAGCGICVNSLDSRQIAKAIEFLLTHPAEAEAMGRRGRQAIIERYNWDLEEGKLLSLYEALTPHRARAAHSRVATAKA